MGDLITWVVGIGFAAAISFFLYKSFKAYKARKLAQKKDSIRNGNGDVR